MPCESLVWESWLEGGVLSQSTPSRRSRQYSYGVVSQLNSVACQANSPGIHDEKLQMVFSTRFLNTFFNFCYLES